MQRRPSTLERALELAALEAPVNFAMTARVEGELDPDRLRSALSRLAPAQPMAGSVLSGTDSDSRLVFQTSVEFPIGDVESAGDRDWVEATRLELVTPFDRRRQPPVRFTLLHGDGWTDLVACCDHAVSDGLSVVYLIRDLLRLIADPAAEIPAAAEMTPPLPRLAPEEVRDRLRFRLRLAGLAARAAFPLLRWLARHKTVPRFAPEGFRLLAWSLDEADTARLISTARRESTTVHAAICAAFLRAFAERQPRKTRRVSCPVNLRERGSTPVGEAFGLLVGIVETSVDCRPERPFWDVARSVKAGLGKAASPERLWWPILLGEEALKERDDSDLRAILRFSPKIRYDLSVTNLGRLDFPIGGVRLLSLHGPAVHSLPDERILGVSTAAGRIHFTFTFRDHTMSRAEAEELRDRAMRILEESCS